MPRSVQIPRLTPLIAAALAVAALSACVASTPYGPALNGKGYTQQQLEDSRYRVSFAGNSHTTRETVENYLLYRAAEITLESGNDYFRVVDQDIEEETRYRTIVSGYGHGFRPFRYHHRFFGHPLYGSSAFVSSTSRPVTSYQAFANILVVQGERPEGDAQAYSAREVIERLGPTIVRSEAAQG